MTDAALPRTVKVVGWVGTAVFWVLLLTLLLVVEMPVADALLVAVLYVAVPILSAGQLPLVRDARIERLPAYWGSIAALWLLGSAAWLVGTRGGGAASLGLVWIGIGPLLAWSAALTAGGLLVIVAFRQIAIQLDVAESPVLRELLPRTTKEKGVFALLSVAAGTGEELAYRGYSIPLFVPLFGPVGAVAATSAVFGALHAYQGVLGVVRTGLMGAMLASGYLASGSLWPAILSHTAIDLIAGIGLGERLLPPSGSTGVVGALDAPDTVR